MSKSTLGPLAVAAWLCAVVPAWGQHQPTLPDGPGKDVVQTLCVQCHGLNLVTNAWGYTKEGWEHLFSSMIALPKEQSAMVAAYLATHFPEHVRPGAVVIPGSAAVSIQEWLVPTLGSRPHDSLAAADGSIWWTGQWANVLGRLDPKTGAMQEYPLKTPKSGPHGLVADPAGNIWYTGNAAVLVGKLNPRTGEVTEYPMPDQAARDPHTPIFDHHGTLWFTLQNASMVGRLTPETGEVTLVTAPTPASRPYGIVVNSTGMPFVVLYGTNKVASIDPHTMAMREYTLLHPQTRARRLAITSDDVIWYADYARGYLGRFDPTTGEGKEWPSPNGP